MSHITDGEPGMYMTFTSEKKEEINKEMVRLKGLTNEVEKELMAAKRRGKFIDFLLCLNLILIGFFLRGFVGFI